MIGRKGIRTPAGFPSRMRTTGDKTPWQISHVKLESTAITARPFFLKIYKLSLLKHILKIKLSASHGGCVRSRKTNFEEQTEDFIITAIAFVHVHIQSDSVHRVKWCLNIAESTNIQGAVKICVKRIAFPHPPPQSLIPSSLSLRLPLPSSGAGIVRKLKCTSSRHIQNI